jgi:hypothetical protein
MLAQPLGDETLPAACWPDPKGMVDELKQMGVELMISPCVSCRCKRNGCERRCSLNCMRGLKEAVFASVALTLKHKRVSSDSDSNEQTDKIRN